MPELNGYETARQIRIKELELRKKHIPIIAFTANRAPGDEEKCLAAGMNAYLSKDIWMPKWRSTLIDNLQGFIVGDFDPEDLQHSANASPVNTEEGFDLEDFDEQALGQVVMLLKDELSIAIDEYLEDAAAYIRDIKKGLQERDPEQTARGSHPLKSNSKSVGLIAVSKIATAINTEAMNGKLERVETLLPQLEEAFSLGEKKLRSTVKCYGY
jgi:CheY-like chemotaxis protein